MEGRKWALATIAIVAATYAIYDLGVGGGALVAAAILLIWAMVSLGRDKNDKDNDQHPDDEFFDDFSGVGGFC